MISNEELEEKQIKIGKDENSLSTVYRLVTSKIEDCKSLHNKEHYDQSKDLLGEVRSLIGNYTKVYKTICKNCNNCENINDNNKTTVKSLSKKTRKNKNFINIFKSTLDDKMVIFINILLQNKIGRTRKKSRNNNLIKCSSGRKKIPRLVSYRDDQSKNFKRNLNKSKKSKLENNVFDIKLFDKSQKQIKQRKNKYYTYQRKRFRRHLLLSSQ